MVSRFRLTALIILLGSLYASFGFAQTVAPAQARFNQTWFGTFTNRLADGKISHDRTVLILTNEREGLSGSIGPAIDRLAPIEEVIIKGQVVVFHITGGGGIDFRLALRKGHLIGTAKGSRVNATLDLVPAPGLLPQSQLITEITAADALNFAAYDKCDAIEYKKYLSPDLEFYQDNQPVKNRQAVIQSLNDRCAEGIKLRRELDPVSLIINASPPDGAIEAGVHRIYSVQPDGSERLDATVRFTMVWSKKSGTWQLVRVISYDHR